MAAAPGVCSTAAVLERFDNEFFCGWKWNSAYCCISVCTDAVVVQEHWGPDVSGDSMTGVWVRIADLQAVGRWKWWDWISGRESYPDK